MFKITLTAMLFLGIGYAWGYSHGWNTSFKRYWRHFVVEGKGSIRN